MNDPKIYLPITVLFAISIVYLSLSVPTFCLIIHFPRFLYLSAVMAIITGVFVYLNFKNRFDFENLYSLTALTILFSFIVWLAFITFINTQYTTKSCQISSYKVVGYQGRVTSGFGILEKEKINANQWILSIIKEDKMETFVLDKDISLGNLVTNSMDLEFCVGLLGTEYLKIEQF